MGSIASGSASPAEWLVSPYLDRLVGRIARPYGFSTDDLADLIQETRIALWEVSSEVPVTAAFVVQVARHKSIDLIRRLRRRRMALRELSVTARSAAEQSELRHLLNVRIAGLPGRLQELYDLHYRKGLSEREIARRWGIARSSVRWLDRQCWTLLTGDSKARLHTLEGIRRGLLTPVAPPRTVPPVRRSAF